MSSTPDGPAVLDRLRAGRAALWINPSYLRAAEDAVPSAIDVPAARARMTRATALIHALFPATAGAPRPISSRLLEADALAAALGSSDGRGGRWLLKADHELPIAGSIKARGGFHEVIVIAEALAVAAGLIDEGEDLIGLASPEARALFAGHTVVVGSTGNLGLAIGVMASALGFRAVVHMSSDAKEWKRQRLRAAGVAVVEHAGDYGNAVAEGRREAEADPRSHFVDDEWSTALFSGYAVAAGELQEQLRAAGVVVDADHPLFVHLPCGVGGAPGGIAFGLQQVFGADVHCFFAEPVEAACMLVQLSSGSSESVSVVDVGLTGRTDADGLAVQRASMLVASLMRSRLAGVFALGDEQLWALLHRASESLQLALEPSAAAGIAGPLMLTGSPTGRRFLAEHGLAERLPDSCHVIWTTGGSLVPAEVAEGYAERARLAQADLSFADA